MRVRNTVRRASLVALMLALLAPTLPRPADAALHVSPVEPAAAIGDAAGGWMPRHLNACGLGLGLMWGGAMGMGLNPLGGAAAFAVGTGIAIFACS